MKQSLAKVSLIMPLYNPNIGFLVKNLELLVKNENDVLREIILVDDGSRCPIENYKTLFSKISPKIFLVWQENKGAGSARNVGVNLAKSDIVAFMDHDCVPRERWLENLIKPIVSGRAVAVGGAILTYKGNNVFSKFSDFMKALREPVKDEKGKIIIIITANAAFSKDVFEEVGGFDQRFNKAGGEDLDLTYKLSQAGYIDRLFYEPLAMLEHEHRSDMKGFLRQQFNYGFWDMYHFLLRNRNPEILWVSFPTPINILRYIWDTTLYSFALIDKIPKSYGLLTKYFTFPLISFLRRMAVMSGGIKCYYFHRPLTSNS